MRLNLLMGVFWLCAAVTLLVFALQGKKFAGLDPDRTYLIIAFGFVLTLYNFARWWSLRSRAAKPPDLPRKKILYGDQQEYLPEFDFDKTKKPNAGDNRNGTSD